MPEQLQFEGAEAFFEEAWTFNCKYYEQLNAIVKHPLQKSNLLKVACHDYFKAVITENERLQRAAALHKANLEVFSARVRDGKQKNTASSIEYFLALPWDTCCKELWPNTAGLVILKSEQIVSLMSLA